MTDEKLTISEIARIFNIPEALLEDPGRATFNNSQAIVDAYVEALAEYFNAKLGANENPITAKDLINFLEVSAQVRRKFKDGGDVGPRIKT